MHWMHLPLYHYRAHFSFSLLALTIASALPAYGGKFNPKFLENVQGIDQHVDLSVYDFPVGLALAVFNWKKWACASTAFRH